MSKKTNRNKRLFGYVVLMQGVSLIHPIVDYYGGGFNINRAFPVAVFSILIGFGIMLAYRD